MCFLLQQTPDTVIDPSFSGLVTESDRRCILHRERAGKFVAFEGTDTGRRFIGCPTEVMDQFGVDLISLNFYYVVETDCLVAVFLNFPYV